VVPGANQETAAETNREIKAKSQTQKSNYSEIPNS